MAKLEPTEVITHANLHDRADELSGTLLTFPREATVTVDMSEYGRGAEQTFANRDAILEYESDCGGHDGECSWRVVVVDPLSGQPVTEAAGTVETRADDQIEVWA